MGAKDELRAGGECDEELCGILPSEDCSKASDPPSNLLKNK